MNFFKNLGTKFILKILLNFFNRFQFTVVDLVSFFLDKCMILIIFYFTWIDCEMALIIFFNIFFIRKIIISINIRRELPDIIFLGFPIFYLMLISFFETWFRFSFFDDWCHFWLKSILILKSMLLLVFLFW